MHLEAGVLTDAYPLRDTSDSSAAGGHSLRLRTADLAGLEALFNDYYRAMAADATAAANPGDATASTASPLRQVARELARFSAAWSAEHAAPVSRTHIESAYALLQRRVDTIPHRTDRLLVAGLAAAALVKTGLRVHVVTDSEQGTIHAGRWLLPVFERLGLTTGVIDAAADETARAAAYRRDVTLSTARELAMDFLRDAVRWPGRGNPARRTIDQLMGSRSLGRSILMRGLPCAIHVDIDSALIENARTPIVLTRDAHPMHEAEELKRALELAGQLEDGRHFELTGEGREVVFNEAGQRQLQAWGQQLGGLWNTPHLAELLLSVAVVATSVLKKDTHYRVRHGTVEWLLQDRLVPGVEFYSRPFITRMVETLEQCPVSSQREEVGRASYQQVFNHYVHLCGLCHSLDGISGELRSVYGLKSAGRAGPAPARRPFRAAVLTPSQAHKLDWLADWAARAEDGDCSIVVMNSAEALEQVQNALEAGPRPPLILSEAADRQFGDLLKPGVLLVALASTMDYLLPLDAGPVPCPVRILVAERSASRTADRRNLFWMQAQSFAAAETTLLLAADDELLTGSVGGAFQSLLDAAGTRVAARLLERRVRRAQAAWGREMYRMRRDLLTHETNMQGLLSFSGRGLYE